MSDSIKSILGRTLGIGAGPEGSNHLFINGLRAVNDPFDSFSQVKQADDFFGDLVADEWVLLSGSDAQALDPAINAQVGGVARLTCGNDATTTMTVNGSQIAGGLNFKAENGELVFETRVKMSAITNIVVFAGFTDAITLEMPINSAGSADTITTTATDACGVFFDTGMATDNWWAAGVANGTDATHVNTTYAPVADTWERWRLQVDSSGNMTVYRNGLRAATVTSAVTASVALAPTVAAFSETTTAHTVDIDYIVAEMDRE